MAYNQNYRPSQPNGGWNREAAPAPKPVQALKLPDAFVDQAEQVMNSLLADEQRDPRNNKPITSTKIRKLFGLFSDLFNEIKRGDEQELDSEQIRSLTTARVRLVYECGRSGNDSDVARFVQQAKLLEYLKGIGTSRAEFLRFHQYFEALVAYHRYRFGDK